MWAIVKEWEEGAVGSSAVLTIRAIEDAGTIARVVNVFEVRGIIPTFMSCRRAAPFILFDIEIASEDGRIDDVLLERLRALVCVDRAEYVRP